MTCVPSKDSDQPGIHSVWSESSLSAWWKLGSLATHWVHCKDPDQTGRMLRPICLRWAHKSFGFVMWWLLSVTLRYLGDVLSRVSSSFGTVNTCIQEQYIWRWTRWSPGFPSVSETHTIHVLKQHFTSKFTCSENLLQFYFSENYCTFLIIINITAFSCTEIYKIQ